MSGVMIELGTPDEAQLDEVVATLRDWQRDDAPIQLHPGDVGWSWRHGPGATAAALRTWRRDGRIVALGMLDGADVLRVTVAPEAWRDDELAQRVSADAADPGRGVLPAGTASVEVLDGTRLREVLSGAGWRDGEAWQPLRLDLATPVPRPPLRVQPVGPRQLPDFVAVHRSAWDSAAFTSEKWDAMASGPAFAGGRCLLGYDDAAVPVAGITVWSAGPGRPGLIEPLGVHRDHRRRGFGRQLCLAAAADLHAAGASSVLVCTPASLTSAVATYVAAGFAPLPKRLDLVRRS